MKLRAAVHVHSSWSYDARLELDELVGLFASHGYDVVFLCEHDRGFDADRWAEYRHACDRATTDEVLLVPGIEYADPEDRVHIPVWGDLPFLGEGLETGALLREVASRRGAAVLAHPVRRDAWSVVDPDWYRSLTGIETWTRKWNGWAPDRRATEAAADAGILPVASLDLHQRHQTFPLAMELTLQQPVTPAGCVDALRTGKCRPVLGRLPATSFGHGALGAAMRGVEKVRRPAARSLRSLRRSSC